MGVYSMPAGVDPRVARVSVSPLSASAQAVPLYDGFIDYDRFVNWERRLAYELTFIEKQLTTSGARQVLDVACGTGKHAIVLAQRGYNPDAVETARRFFNGELAPDDMLLATIKLGKAYYHRLGPLQLVRDVLLGLRVRSRPEAQIYGYGQLLKGWSVMDRLAEIQVPTLVMAGRSDFQFPPEHQEQLASRIPNARLEIIERAGHNAPTERTAEVVQAVRDFMASASVLSDSRRDSP